MAAPESGMTFHPHARCRWCSGRFVRLYDTQWLCESDACQQKQIAHATLKDPRPEDASSPYLYLPTPAQVELRECKTKKLLWGGAAGGAKSHGLRWDAYFWCAQIEGYEVLLMRRTYPELESTHLLRMERDAKVLGAKYRSQHRMLEWPNGSFIKAGHCESKSDLSKLLSTEYDDIRIDEASTFEGKLIREIGSRARSAKPAVVERGGAYFRLGSNPGGVGALYLRDAYITKSLDLDEFPDYDASEYAFIPAKVSDNPFLDPTYEKELRQLDRGRREQLLDGSWDVFVGQFFADFSADLHVSAMEAP